MINEALYLLGEVFYRQAFLLAPFALVSVAENVVQLLITFVLGIILTLFLPRLFTENLSKTMIAKRVVAVLLMIGGLVLIG